MILYNTILPKIQKQLGMTYSSSAHTPGEIVGYVNSALKYMAARKYPWLILVYEFTADGTKAIYSIPTQHSTKQIFCNGEALVQDVDWVTAESYQNNTDMIGVFYNQIILPDSANTDSYKIQYRGIPSLVTMNAENGNATDGFEINLPEDLEDALIFLSAYYGLVDNSEHEVAKEKLGLYTVEIQNIQVAYNNIDENKPKRLSAGHNFMGPHIQ